MKVLRLVCMVGGGMLGTAEAHFHQTECYYWCSGEPWLSWCAGTPS